MPNVLSKRPRWLTQLSLAAAKGTANIMMPQDVEREMRAIDKEAITANLTNCVRPYGTIPDTLRTLNPYPALLPQQFITDLERFNEVLALAYNNIILRWWKDTEAKFSSRMPLDPQAEALLRVSFTFPKHYRWLILMISVGRKDD